MRGPISVSWTYAALVALALQATAPAQPELRRFEFVESHMGTACRVVLHASDPDEAERAARAAFEEIALLEASMSLFRPSSELSRLNRDGSLEASEPLYEVLAAARRQWRLSGGAFDVTVGPVARLWRQAREAGRLPDDETLRAALARVGSQHLELGPGRRVRLTGLAVTVDLGGIAKGYAARRALERLAANGCDRALVDVGGELALGAPPPGRECWRVEVAGGCPESLCLHDRGVATSGDTAQFVELDGRRYSHVIDPRTGLGTHRVLRATVVAPDAMTADALATALVVLGPEQGLELAGSLAGVEASICWREGDRTAFAATDGLAGLGPR